MNENIVWYQTTQNQPEIQKLGTFTVQNPNQIKLKNSEWKLMKLTFGWIWQMYCEVCKQTENVPNDRECPERNSVKSREIALCFFFVIFFVRICACCRISSMWYCWHQAPLSIDSSPVVLWLRRSVLSV